MTAIALSETLVVMVHRFEIFRVPGVELPVHLPKKMQKVFNFLKLTIDGIEYSLKCLISHNGTSIKHGHYVCQERVGEGFMTHSDDHPPTMCEQPPETTPYMFFYEVVHPPHSADGSDLEVSPLAPPPPVPTSQPPQPQPTQPQPASPKSQPPPPTPPPPAPVGPRQTRTPLPAAPGPRPTVRPRKSVMDYFKK